MRVVAVRGAVVPAAVVEQQPGALRSLGRHDVERRVACVVRRAQQAAAHDGGGLGAREVPFFFSYGPM